MRAIANLDLTGYTQRDEEDVWTDDQGVIISTHYFDMVPDLPAGLDEPDRLKSGLARFIAGAGAGLIEASVVQIDALPAVWQLAKVSRPNGTGQVFLGSYTVPKAMSSVVIKAQAAEGGMTGFREAVVLDRLGPERYFQPHPYAADLQGGLPYHAADSVEWDEQFPDHPLTLVRRALSRIIPTVRFEEGFRALPAFTD